MRLDELNQIPASFSHLAAPIEAKRAENRYGIDPIYDQLEGELGQYGFKYEGAGCSGMVFSHPLKTYVLKISVIDDAAYREFVNICRKSINPHFPRIVGKPVVFKKNFLISRVEKLTDISSKDFRKVKNANSYLLQLLLTPQELITHAQYDWLLPETYIDDEAATNFITRYPQWQKAIQTSVRLARKYGELDLHKGNHMMRGDIPVIIDPVAVEHDWSPL